MRKGRRWRLAIDDRLKAVSMKFTVRRVPGAQRSRYESSWPATFTSLAPGSSAPPRGRSESASAASVALRAVVKDMPTEILPFGHGWSNPERGIEPFLHSCRLFTWHLLGFLERCLVIGLGRPPRCLESAPTPSAAWSTTVG